MDCQSVDLTLFKNFLAHFIYASILYILYIVVFIYYIYLSLFSLDLFLFLKSKFEYF